MVAPAKAGHATVRSLESWDSIQVFPVSSGVQTFAPRAAAFPGTLNVVEMEMEGPELQSAA